MKKILFFVALILSLQIADAQRRSVRLMTYNVGAFGKELEDSAPMIARMIGELGAETVSLNELDSCNRRHNIDQAQHLADELNAVAAAANHRQSWKGQFGRAMAYADGAYGCGMQASASGTLNFYSYRDPNPARTLGVYRDCADWLRGFCDRRESFDQLLIGAVSDSEPLLSPEDGSRLAAEAVLRGVTLAQ